MALGWAGRQVVGALTWPGGAASAGRRQTPPGPYRSFRELSLAGSVDPVTWCPPTFVGNSGIECSNGHRGFALFFLPSGSLTKAVIPRESGVSTTPRLPGSITNALEYWITRFRG